MPYTTIHTSSTMSREAAESLAAEVTQLLQDVLAKRADLSVVRVVDQPSSWFVGLSRAAAGLAAVEVHVTEGTTTPSQRAEFIAGVHTALTGHGLGGSPSYVVVHEHAGDAWGYDGSTQSSRR